jgi:hypothetical protein
VSRALAFASGVALLVPAWALPAIASGWAPASVIASGWAPAWALPVGTGGWVPGAALAVAAGWLRLSPAGEPRRAVLGGLAVGVVALAWITTPAVLPLLLVLALGLRTPRPPATRELPAAVAAQGRRLRRLFRLATSAAVAVEVRVHDAGPQLLRQHRQAWHAVLAARSALATAELVRAVLLAAAVAAVVTGTALLALLRPAGTDLLAAAWAAAVVARQALR